MRIITIYINANNYHLLNLDTSCRSNRNFQPYFMKATFGNFNFAFQLPFNFRPNLSKANGLGPRPDLKPNPSNGFIRFLEKTIIRRN